MYRYDKQIETFDAFNAQMLSHLLSPLKLLCCLATVEQKSDAI